MKEQNLNEDTQEVEVETEQVSDLHKVTPLSKYLAMVLFIILPFIGGWIGYTYAPEKMVEVERVLDVKKLAENLTVDVDYSNCELVPLSDEYGTSDYTDNKLVCQNGKGEPVVLVESMNSHITEASDENINTILISQSKDYKEVYIASHNWYTECCALNLYTYSLENGGIEKLGNISSNSLGFLTGDISPDGNKWAKFIYDPYLEGEERLMVYDLSSDSYHEVLVVDSETETSASSCELTCVSSLEWIDNKTLEYSIFDKTSVDSTLPNDFIEKRRIEI